MTRGRLDAFSDGVLAIIITIMVLEFKVPGHGNEMQDLRPLIPVFSSYVLSFVYIGIYWNNHHHLLHAAPRPSAGIMWANLHLLFWLSLVPFVTGWMGDHAASPAPVALYGVVMMMAAVAYWILQRVIVLGHGAGSALARALGADLKGNASVLAYAAAIPAAYASPWISWALYILVAAVWIVPDRRIERALAEAGREAS